MGWIKNFGNLWINGSDPSWPTSQTSLFSPQPYTPSQDQSFNRVKVKQFFCQTFFSFFPVMYIYNLCILLFSCTCIKKIEKKKKNWIASVLSLISSRVAWGRKKAGSCIFAYSHQTWHRCSLGDTKQFQKKKCPKIPPLGGREKQLCPTHSFGYETINSKLFGPVLFQ